MKLTKRQFEEREVFKQKGLKKKLMPTGYEAFRISPRSTTKYGKKYKKIYGATIEPDYSRGEKGKYGAKVKWYPHGYTSGKAKGGTTMLQPLKDYPVNQTEARYKLMLKKKK